MATYDNEFIDTLVLGTRILVAEQERKNIEEQLLDMSKQLLATKEELRDTLDELDREKDWVFGLMQSVERERDATSSIKLDIS